MKYSNLAYDILPVTTDSHHKRAINNDQQIYNSVKNSHIIKKRSIELSKFCDLDYVINQNNLTNKITETKYFNNIKLILIVIIDSF